MDIMKYMKSQLLASILVKKIAVKVKIARAIKFK